MPYTRPPELNAHLRFLALRKNVKSLPDGTIRSKYFSFKRGVGGASDVYTLEHRTTGQADKHVVQRQATFIHKLVNEQKMQYEKEIEDFSDPRPGNALYGQYPADSDSSHLISAKELGETEVAATNAHDEAAQEVTGVDDYLWKFLTGRTKKQMKIYEALGTCHEEAPTSDEEDKPKQKRNKILRNAATEVQLNHDAPTEERLAAMDLNYELLGNSSRNTRPGDRVKNQQKVKAHRDYFYNNRGLLAPRHKKFKRSINRVQHAIGMKHYQPKREGGKIVSSSYNPTVQPPPKSMMSRMWKFLKSPLR